MRILTSRHTLTLFLPIGTLLGKFPMCDPCVTMTHHVDV